MNGTPDKVLVLVDGFSSSAQLPKILAEHGWSCVHVRADHGEAPAWYQNSFRPADYLAVIPFDDDIQALARRVAQYRPTALLPGTETGVRVADRLAAALKLPGNDPSSSEARRNKYEMHKRVRAAGLRAMDDYRAEDLDGLLAWAKGGAWPVVLKPLDSAGTDLVIFCADEQETQAAYDRIRGTRNAMGETNEAVLAQRLLTGDEYFVNGVSGGGRHVITEIWRTEKLRVPGAGMIYDRSVLLDPTEPEQSVLVDYLYGVLDAVGSRYGVNHTEIMVDAQGRPTLIEVASRFSGGLNPAAAATAVGHSVFDLAVMLLERGEGVVGDLADARTPHRAQLWQVQFISEQTGVVAASYYEELIGTLRSDTWIQRAPQPGDRVERTVDLFTSPGIVFMSHPDPEVLAQDCAAVRAWEREHRMFALEPATSPPGA